MKKILVVLSLFALQALIFSLPVQAADFLGVPLPDGGQKTMETRGQVRMVYQESLAAVSDFYRQSFKDNDADLKFKEKPGQLKIEDFGSRPWHAIVLVQQADGSVTVTVAKDTWGWILTTLFLRFVGVFVVLSVLLIAVSAATAIISRLSKPQEAKT